MAPVHPRLDVLLEGLTTPILRDVAIPVLSAYMLLIGVVVYAVRHPETGGSADRPAGWRARLRLIAITIVGGYGCFIAIVLVFHVWIARQAGALMSAIRGGAFLAVMSAVAFMAASVIEGGRR